MKLFISYARRDADSIAAILRSDLESAGVEVWWDRASMESRGRAFLQEIRDGIAACERMLLLLTPEAVRSEYVTSEWEFALEVCVVVTPIIISGDISSLPQRLSMGHLVDFRPPRPYGDAFEELKRIVKTPVAPLAQLYDVDALPPHHIPHPERIDSLDRLVRSDARRPSVITSAGQSVSLQGMGGVGKTVLAVEFALRCDIRRAFPDGIVWLRFAADLDRTATNLEVLRSIFDQRGQMSTALKLDALATHLRSALEHRVCLVVLDDVWRLSEVETFTRILGARMRLLVTTRDASIARALGAGEIALDVFTEDEALRLLASWASSAVDKLPDEAAAIAGECGYLPFALAICGAMIRGQVPWSDVLSALREADLQYLRTRLPHYRYPDLFKALKVGVDQLAQEEPLAAELYRELAAFRPQAPFTEKAVINFWTAGRDLSEREVRRLLALLLERSLMLRSGAGFLLHDLAADFLRALTPDVASLTERLLSAYWSKSHGEWHRGPNDGYFFENLPFHLVEAGRKEEVRPLLLDAQWIAAKLRSTSPAATLQDYAWFEKDPSVSAVANAIRLESHRLQDSKKVAGQLLRHLIGSPDKAVQELTQRLREVAQTPWLEPSKSPPPRTGILHRSIVVGTAAIEGVALTPDGENVLVSSGASGEVDPKPGFLGLFSTRTGNLLWEFAGHTFDINQVAISPDGRLAASSSRDKTVCVWDLKTKTLTSRLEGHNGDVRFVAMNDEYVVSGALGEPPLCVWHLASGQAIAAPTLELIGGVLAVGKYGFALAQKDLHLWELANASTVWQLTQGEAFDVTANAAFAVVMSDEGRVTVWDLASRVQVLELQDDEVIKDKSYHYVRFLDDRTVITLSGEWEKEHASVMKVWSLADRKRLVRETGHTTLVTALGVARQGRVGATGTLSGEVKVWHLDESRIRLASAQVQQERTLALGIDTATQSIVSTTVSGLVQIMDVETLEVRDQLGEAGRKHDQMRVFPNGLAVTWSSHGTTLDVWSLNDRSVVRHPLAVTALSDVTLTGAIWTVSCDGMLMKWEAADLFASGGSEIRPLLAYKLPHVPNLIPNPWGPDPFSTLYPVSICIVADECEVLVGWGGGRGTEFHFGGWDFPIALLDLRAMKIRQIKSFPAHQVRQSLALSRSEYVLSVRSNVLEKWSRVDLSAEFELKHATDDAFFVAPLDDERKAVSVTAEGEIRIWDLQTGTSLTELYLDELLTSAAIAHDGQTLVIGTRAGSLQSIRLHYG